jgi:hypothetical protein
MAQHTTAAADPCHVTACMHRNGLEVPRQLQWVKWHAGGEFVKVLCVKNVSTDVSAGGAALAQQLSLNTAPLPAEHVSPCCPAGHQVHIQAAACRQRLQCRVPRATQAQPWHGCHHQGTCVPASRLHCSCTVLCVVCLPAQRARRSRDLLLLGLAACRRLVPPDMATQHEHSQVMQQLACYPERADSGTGAPPVAADVCRLPFGPAHARHTQTNWS